jgi:hypothetical protein
LSVTSAVAEIAHYQALLPLAWLGALRARRQSRDLAFWLLALAFAVSWIADGLSTLVPSGDRWAVSLAYLATQAMIVGAVLLARTAAAGFATVLLGAAVVAIVWQGARTPDILVHTVAMLGVAGIVIDRPALGARTSLLVYFGVGWCCWVGYAIAPGWWTWGAYQIARLAGLLLFCRAVALDRPHLRVA